MTNVTPKPVVHPDTVCILKGMSNVLHRTPCASAVLAYFGVTGVTWNNRTRQNVWPDTLRRNGYAVRSRMSKVGKGKTVGGIRATLAKVADAEPEILAFVVRVEAHVLIVDRTGRTIVDTDPRKRDTRKVLGVMAVMSKGTEPADVIVRRMRARRHAEAVPVI